MNGFFVTGTDTGVGKTFVSATIARRARAANKKVFAFKPIETGCDPDGADQLALVEAAGGWQSGRLRGVYRFHLPVAPLVAAEAENTSIDLELILETARAGAAMADLTLIEGAGGWRVPLTADADTSTLARALGYPIIVVARATLGTINHTLLTLEAIERDQLPIAAVVVSRRPEDDQGLCASSADQIARRWSGRLLIGPESLDSIWCST
jgi:dethiobiotin synthetase